MRHAAEQQLDGAPKHDVGHTELQAPCINKTEKNQGAGRGMQRVYGELGRQTRIAAAPQREEQRVRTPLVLALPNVLGTVLPVNGLPLMSMLFDRSRLLPVKNRPGGSVDSWLLASDLYREVQTKGRGSREAERGQ